MANIERSGQAAGALKVTLDLINSAETAEQKRSIIDSLQADLTSGVVEGSLNAQRQAVDTINNRQASLRQFKTMGVAAGDGLSEIGFWLQGYGNRQDKDNADGVAGWDGDTYGMALGFDKDINESWAAGMAFSYASSDIESKNKYRNTLDIDSYQLSAYGSYVSAEWYSDVVVSYAYNQYQGQRNLQTIAPFATADSDYSGDQFQLRARGGWPFLLDSGLMLTPTASIEYTYLKEDTYSETGAGSNGLDVDADSVEVLLFTAGGRAAYAATLSNNITLVPEVALQLRYDAIGDQIQVDSNFIGVNGAAFILRGAEVEPTSGRLTLGLSGYGDGRVSFNVAYDYFFQQDFNAQALTGTLKWMF